MSGSDPKTIISAQVETAQRGRLAALAAANERSLSGELRRAVDTYLRLHEVPRASGPSRGTPDELRGLRRRGAHGDVA